MAGLTAFAEGRSSSAASGAAGTVCGCAWQGGRVWLSLGKPWRTRGLSVFEAGRL